MPLLPATTKAALEELLETCFRPVPSHWKLIKLNQETVGYLCPTDFETIRTFLDQNDLHGISIYGEHLQLERILPIELNQALDQLVLYLKQQQLVPGWRDEMYSWHDENGHERFRIERAAFRTLGLHSRACHINGYTVDGHLWLGRRSADKATDPNMLDNMAAGGLCADETILQCSYRELWEEAGMAPEVSRTLEPIGKIQVRRTIEPSGLHDESLFTFDLALPQELEPQNYDGEVAAFTRMNYLEAADAVLAGELTPDASVVTADFLLRRA